MSSEARIEVDGAAAQALAISAMQMGRTANESLSLLCIAIVMVSAAASKQANKEQTIDELCADVERTIRSIRPGGVQ